MASISFTLKDNTLYFHRAGDPTHVVYRIEADQLMGILPKDPGVSFWILYLHRQPWGKPELLYQIAQLIQQLHPDAGIDWEKTFAYVEAKASLNRSLATGEPQKESKEELLARVRERLREHGL